MRYIVMHKVDPKMEAGDLVDREIVKNMGALIGESLRDGIFLDGAGLHRSARRVRLRCARGECELARGPYEGGNELVESMALIRTDSIETATNLARRFGAALADAEIEIGPVVEPWDLKGAPKPANVVGEQFLLLFKGDASYERGGAMAPERDAAIRQIDDELMRTGVLVKRFRIAPSATGKRLAAGPKGKRAWTDGPFAESKELIAGFSILELASLDEALAWADRYAAILEGNEVDVRQMAE